VKYLRAVFGSLATLAFLGIALVGIVVLCLWLTRSGQPLSTLGRTAAPVVIYFVPFALYGLGKAIINAYDLDR
jgi:hypothetical protein